MLKPIRAKMINCDDPEQTWLINPNDMVVEIVIDAKLGAIAHLFLGTGPVLVMSIDPDIADADRATQRFLWMLEHGGREDS